MAPSLACPTAPPRPCGPNQRCLHTSHAEENALGFCDGLVSTAYVTHEPCLTCTRALIRRGVRRVVYFHPYTSIAEQEKAEREGNPGAFRGQVGTDPPRESPLDNQHDHCIVHRALGRKTCADTGTERMDFH